MLPSQYAVIGSQILNIVLVGLGAIDLNYHSHLLTNPLTLVIMAVLSAIGIQQTINPTVKKQ